MDLAGWEEMYRSGERGNEHAPSRLVVEAIDRIATGNALDLACGSGRNTVYMAERGWAVTAVDGSAAAIELLRRRAETLGLRVHTEVADLTEPSFAIPHDTFDFALIAYYLQRDLFPRAKAAVRPGGVVVAVVHIPMPGEEANYKRASPGELRGFFRDWEVLWEYEGPSRDPAHRRPVAEIVARRPVLAC